MDHIVGMMWNKNEGDILEEILEDAIRHVDSLFIADDGSTDNSWQIILSFKKRHPDKVEHVRNAPDRRDKAQRTALLGEIKKRYKPENTWVQIIESDIMILDTDIRDVLSKYASANVGLSWQCLNACRLQGTWGDVDTYPKWKRPIKDIMPYGHRMETMTYTFRPVNGLRYSNSVWRPWPNGLGKHGFVGSNRKYVEAPLLAHYGYRGPTHYYLKFKDWHKKVKGKYHPKYRTWDLSSPESIEKTVHYFNGQWNRHPFAMSRAGWSKRCRRKRYEDFKNG